MQRILSASRSRSIELKLVQSATQVLGLVLFFYVSEAGTELKTSAFITLSIHRFLVPCSIHWLVLVLQGTSDKIISKLLPTNFNYVKKI